MDVSLTRLTEYHNIKRERNLKPLKVWLFYYSMFIGNFLLGAILTIFKVEGDTMPNRQVSVVRRNPSKRGNTRLPRKSP